MCAFIWNTTQNHCWGLYSCVVLWVCQKSCLNSFFLGWIWAEQNKLEHFVTQLAERETPWTSHRLSVNDVFNHESTNTSRRSAVSFFFLKWNLFCFGPVKPRVGIGSFNFSSLENQSPFTGCAAIRNEKCFRLTWWESYGSVSSASQSNRGRQSRSTSPWIHRLITMCCTNGHDEK